jgi:transposase
VVDFNDHDASSEDSHVSIHRMEIVSGTGRRRSWSTALKEQLVSETLEPGVTVTEVARRHDLDRSLIYRWRRAFGVRRARAAGAFLPVEVVDDAAAATESSPPRMTSAPAPGAGRIEIEFSDGYLVRVDNQVDDNALARVLRVLARQG